MMIPQNIDITCLHSYWHGIIEGRYNFSRKTGLDATYCNPTNWIVKTIKSAQGFKSYKEGYSNGFQLSPKFSQLFVDWKNNQILNTNTHLAPLI